MDNKGSLFKNKEVAGVHGIDKKLNREIAIDFDIKLIKARLKLPISDKDRQSYEKRLAELQKQKEAL